MGLSHCFWRLGEWQRGGTRVGWEDFEKEWGKEKVYVRERKTQTLWRRGKWGEVREKIAVLGL
jgi:hypothetical protein